MACRFCSASGNSSFDLSFEKSIGFINLPNARAVNHSLFTYLDAEAFFVHITKIISRVVSASDISLDQSVSISLLSGQISNPSFFEGVFDLFSLSAHL